MGQEIINTLYKIILKIVSTFFRAIYLIVYTICDLLLAIVAIIFFIPKLFIILIDKVKEKINKDSIGKLIETVIDLIFQCITLIIIIPKKLISILLEYLNKTNDNIKKRIEIYKADRIAKKYIWMLKQCLLLNSTIFTNLGFHYFIVIITIGLQFISMFTTFRGVHYYFGNITIPKWIAPIIVTLLIQGTLVLLSNTLMYKNKMNKRRYFALFFVCLISIFFSYTGLVNSVIPPNKDMKANYNDFYEKFSNEEKLYKAQHTEKNFEEYIKNKYDNLVDLCEKTRDTLDNKINSMGEDTTTTTNIDTNPDGSSHGTTTKSSKRNTAKEDAIAQKNEIQNDLSNLRIYYRRIESELKNVDNVTQNTQTNGNDADINDKIIDKLIEIDKKNDVKNYIRQYNSAIDSLVKVDNKINISKVTNLQSEYLDFQLAIKKINIKNYDDILNELESKHGYKMNESNLEDLNYISNAIIENIETYEKSAINVNNTKLNDAAEKAKTIEDYNIKTIEYFFMNNYKFKALSMLVAAIFIDGMTVLLPLLLEIPKKSILYVRSRKNLIYEEEEMIEKLLENNSPIKENFIDNVKDLRDKLVEFSDLFKFSHREALENGYSQYCNKIDIENFIKSNRNLMSFITFLKVVEYLYYDEENVFCIEGKNETKHNYYIRTKFVFWLSECISSLNRYLENKSILDSITKEDDNNE